MATFPIIDVSALSEKYLEGDGYLQDISNDPITKDISDQIIDAFSQYGFIYIKGHGIPENQINGVFEESRNFFKFDSETKKRFSRTSNDNWGYVPYKVETFEKIRPFDLKECFNYLPLTDKTQDMNATTPDFISKNTSFYGVCKKLGVLLIKAITLGLNTDDKVNFLYNHHNGIGNFSKNATTLRLLYYPAIEDSSTVLEHQLRCGEHSDYGTITLLFQDDAGGLQVVSPSGEYVDAKPIPGCIVVNAGDMLQIWSGQKLKSTRHRVVVPTNINKARQSLAFFLHPNNDCVVEDLVNKEQNVKTNAWDYLMKKFGETY
ncbi:uncharacterized protein [Clytia hemisphaerica]|uniref:Fe2OG dioxygenase domain-containing protein n=1 Tax=Clytia hemisphaerica TaxID=252671 RepID=A0A7M5WXD6_9CNID|eukprot:TCONS_00014004-protein